MQEKSEGKSQADCSYELFGLLLGTALSSLFAPNHVPTERYESDIQTRHKAIAERDVSHHNLAMIVSWKHKGLRVFFETGSTKGINADHAKRLRRVLLVLNRAKHRDELDLPGWWFHRLKGDLVDYLDYH